MSSSSSDRVWLYRVLLLVFSVGIVLVFGELVVRIAVPVRNVGPSWTMHHPVYLRSIRPNLSARRRSPEFDTVFTTNSYGFRGAEPASTPSGAIVFLGDSFTMGYGVTDGEDFPALVGDALHERMGDAAPEVVNGGNGRGNGYWVKFLEHEASDYSPRYVVLMASSNDARDNRIEKLFKLDGGALVELPVRPPSSLRTLQAWLELIPRLNETYLYGLSRQIRFSPLLSSTPPAKKNQGRPAKKMQWHDDLTLALMDRSLEICAEKGWPVVLGTADMTPAEVEGIAKVAAERGVQLIRIPAKSERGDLYYEVDGHWTSEGHVLAAGKVMSWVLGEAGL